MDLHAKLEKVQSELASERQRGALSDQGKIYTLEQQEKDLMEQIHKAEHEQRVETSAQEISYLLDTISAEGMSMREMCQSESHYQVLRIEVERKYAEQAGKFSEEIGEMQKSYTDKLRASEDRELQLQRQLDALQADHKETAELLNSAKFELADMQTKRDNASIALEEARREIERLNSQVDDLRKEMAVGARNAYKVIDTEEQQRQYTEAMEKIKKDKENRPKIYDKVQIDMKGSRFKAKYVETGEEFEFSYLEEGKYNIIQDEQEVQRFRAEAERAKADRTLDDSSTPDKEVTFQVPALPTFPVPMVDGERTGETQGEDTPVTRKEVTEMLNQFAAEHGLVKGQVA
ncbi:hypothetical protein [Paenibacillus lutrae]|uniref:Uncharacterized protein n=1 Tax=Paenibacillus lutrae TaxID=2078573 RepID=A0A7X3FIZ5_9BACL|nr:hypothetical protein [Paenibacillus lutrae]MVP00364.1 hypothetical protein [Paenibacillus lutrae]